MHVGLLYFLKHPFNLTNGSYNLFCLIANIVAPAPVTLCGLKGLYDMGRCENIPLPLLL